MKNKPRTKEPQYNVQFRTIEKIGPVEMGPTASHLWRNDPRHLSFLFSRYKFCSKILAGKKKVLEVGCGDGMGTALLLQTVSSVHGIDFDPLFVNWAKKHYKKEKYNCSFEVSDIIKNKPSGGPFDAAYALDLIEHISGRLEKRFMRNICDVLKDDAVLILGTPNLAAKKYAGKDSKEGHVNLKDAGSLKALMLRYFSNVFIFSMNDEVVHTGFYPMANYLIGIGAGLRKTDGRD